MAKTIPLMEIQDSFQSNIADFFDDYEKEMKINIDKTLEKVANQFKDDLMPVIPVSQNEPGEFGHLRDSAIVKRKVSKGNVSYVFGFWKKGWLALILEYGWKNRGGGMVKREPFVRPTFDMNKDKYFKTIKDDIQKQSGGNDG